MEWDRQFAETEGERSARLAKKRRQMQACFKDCSAGLHLDFENGCVSKCDTWEACVGWRAYS